jgi:transposase-like protein
MPTPRTPICIELTEDERIDLRHMARAHCLPHRAVVRAQAILALADGKTVSAVARQVGRQRRIVRKWAERFVRKRLRGLEDAARSGRPARFSPSGRDAPDQARLRDAGSGRPVAVAVELRGAGAYTAA